VSAESSGTESLLAPLKFAATMTVYATVIVNDREPLDRVTGPGGDEWRSQFYDLHTDEDVIEHFVFNAVTNHVHDITRLEGWADCDAGAVTIEVDDTDQFVELLP
jgi:hypothetical protein